MVIIAIIIALASTVWSLTLLRYHDLPLGSAIFLVVTSTFSSEFFGVDAGGLTWTLDRFWLVFLLMQIGYNAYVGRLKLRQIQTSDLILLSFTLWLIARTLAFPLGSTTPEQPPTLMHLLNGYLIPIFIYALIRCSRVTPASIYPAVIVILGFGVYLSITAVLETVEMWSLVFPKFIGNPNLGIHFGRARGPMLQSVRMGMCLNFCLITLWTFVLFLRRYDRWAWVVTAMLTPLFLLAIFLTKTRSIWMATAAIIVIALFTMLRGKARTITIGSLMITGLFGAIVVGPSLVAFKREYSEAETLESTYMRGAFAYVSYKMFMDKPIVGYGFNQFQIYNLPYLDDRTTTMRLESIRGYVHHNSYASILVDLGLVGGILYAGCVFGFARIGWRLYFNRAAPPWARATVIFAAGVVASHAIQMAFHEISFSTIEHLLMAIALGLMTACSQDYATARSLGASWFRFRARSEKMLAATSPSH